MSQNKDSNRDIREVTDSLTTNFIVQDTDNSQISLKGVNSSPKPELKMFSVQRIETNGRTNDTTPVLPPPKLAPYSVHKKDGGN